MSRALPFLLLALTACSVTNGDGIAGSEMRELEDFDAIANASNVPVVVEVGPAQSVRISCDQNLLPLIETQVEGGMLEVSIPFDTTVVPTLPCQLDVTVPSLVEVQNSDIGGVEVFGAVVDLGYARNTGLGEIAAAGIDTASLRAVNRHGGGLVLAGVVDWADLDNLGAGGIQAEELVCEGADVTNSGSGDVTVTVTGTAVVHVSDTGNVVLLGDPDEVITEDSGCGDVEQGS